MHWRGRVVIEREGMRERKEREGKRKPLSRAQFESSGVKRVDGGGGHVLCFLPPPPHPLPSHTQPDTAPLVSHNIRASPVAPT
ncbi:hypothetical protein EVAR_100213_1 [Eumeta japonica]|uniref:Uncharacterized protein n=1 Tax=Eumeta variegata TaxID=151549 RepID=A0A4C1ZJJ4_EUMVA|nr:hypothetical protein EVAR_100213_1 [Eumeta japonica]